MQRRVKVALDPGMARGSLFAPIHWSAQTASHARIGAAVQAMCDPWSGQPEMKATPSSIEPVTYAAQGFVLSRDALRCPRAVGGRGWLSRARSGLFATDAGPAELMAAVRARFEEADLTELVDMAGAPIAAPSSVRAGLLAALFLAPFGRPAALGQREARLR